MLCATNTFGTYCSLWQWWFAFANVIFPAQYILNVWTYLFCFLILSSLTFWFIVAPTTKLFRWVPKIFPIFWWICDILNVLVCHNPQKMFVQFLCCVLVILPSLSRLSHTRQNTSNFSILVMLGSTPIAVSPTTLRTCFLSMMSINKVDFVGGEVWVLFFYPFW